MFGKSLGQIHKNLSPLSCSFHSCSMIFLITEITQCYYLKPNNFLTVFMPQLTSFPRWAVVRFFHFLFTVATSLSTWRYCHTINFRICLFLIHTCINVRLRWRSITNVLFCSSNTITPHKIAWIVWKIKRPALWWKCRLLW